MPVKVTKMEIVNASIAASTEEYRELPWSKRWEKLEAKIKETNPIYAGMLRKISYNAEKEVYVGLFSASETSEFSFRLSNEAAGFLAEHRVIGERKPTVYLRLNDGEVSDVILVVQN